jgi:Ca-activated chloride channel family protein
MRTCRWLASSAAAVALLVPVFAQSPTIFKTDVSLVRAVATVKNPAGQLVGTLQKADFEIFDNGAKQEISVFEHHTGQSLSVALLIDTSGSTAKDLKYEADASSRFARALLEEGNIEDAISLYSFNWQVRQETRYSRDLKLLEARLKLLRGEAGTALYDALVFGARDLEPREGRKAIVVVTDGGNTVSKYTIDDALQAAQLADAVIYSVVVVPITNEVGRNIGGEHALQILAERTGGKIFFPAAGPDLDKVFREIITELRTQYLIGFYPKDVPLTKNPFHTLEVKVKQPGMHVSARNGYYGAALGVRPASSGADRVTLTPERQKPQPPPPTRPKK